MQGKGYSLEVVAILTPDFLISVDWENRNEERLAFSNSGIDSVSFQQEEREVRKEAY